MHSHLHEEKFRLDTIQLPSTCNEDCECNAVRKPFLRELNPLCPLHNCSFNELLETDNANAGKSATLIDGKVQLVLTDPPYNVRRNNNRSNSAYDYISALCPICSP